MGLLILDALIQFVSHTINVPINQVTFLICIFLTYPFGYINRYIKSPNKRLWFGLISGVLLQYQMYGLAIIHVIIATIVTYLFIQYYGRKYSAFYVLIFTILHLSFLHLRNMLYSYGDWALGIETCYMMSICKFSTIAFNYEDGGKLEEELKSSHFRKTALKEKPTLLEVASYVYYYPTVLTGPSFEYSYFKKFINLEDEYKNIKYDKCNKSALYNIFWGVVFSYVVMTWAKDTDPNYCGSEEFANKNFLYKYLYVYASIFVTRSRYYVAWKLVQGSVDFCGLAYTVKLSENNIEEISFDKIDQCNLTVMELSINPKVKIQYWNRSTHLWLKYYIFLRLINVKFFMKKKGLASLITFLISAIWHGFYPSYYLFFLHLFFIDQIAIFLDEEFDLFNQIEKKNLVVRLIFLQFLMSFLEYFGQTFTILSVGHVFNYYKAFYFMPNIVMVLLYIYITFIYKKQKNNKSNLVKTSENTPEHQKLKETTKIE